MDYVALKRLHYPRGRAGREYQPGERFAASEKDGKVLVAVKIAAYAPPSEEAEPKASPIAHVPYVGQDDTALDDTQTFVAVEPVIVTIPYEPLPEAEAAAADEIAKLRTEFERLTGEKPDGRWGLARLRSEIDKIAED